MSVETGVRRTDRTVAEFAKNSREVIRVAEGEYKGHRLVHVRSWVPRDNGTMIPTRNGLSIRRELIPQMIDALQKAFAVTADSADKPAV